MRQTEVQWIDVNTEMPTTEEFGPYPTVLVAMECVGLPEWGFSTRWAELRFFGKDKARPYWAALKKEDNRPIENDSWRVAYWAPPFKTPNVHSASSHKTD